MWFGDATYMGVCCVWAGAKPVGPAGEVSCGSRVGRSSTTHRVHYCWSMLWAAVLGWVQHVARGGASYSTTLCVCGCISVQQEVDAMRDTWVQCIPLW